MEEIKLTIPDSWDDIKLGQYQEYIQYLEDNKDERQYKLIINLLSILTDTDSAIFYKMPMDTLYSIQKNIKFMEEEPTIKFKNIIEVDGVKYGFQKDLHNLTLGEWIDIEHYITNGNIINNLHYLAAIFYRKIIKESDEYFDYEIESYNDIKLEGRAKLFQHKANIMDIYGIVVFFYLIVSELMNSIGYYSTEMTMKEKIAMLIDRIKDIELKKKLMQLHEKNQLENGIGNSSYIVFLEEILQNMTES
jgi:hypothetical protein